MALSKKLIKLYDSINLYERYKEISSFYNDIDNALQKTDKILVLNVFEDLGYPIKYNTSEKFYSITEEIENNTFYFHVSLRFGIVELIFGLKKDIEGEHVGGTIVGICKRIEITKNNMTEGYIRGPAFTDYKQLKEILKKSIIIFEDFKKAFYSTYAE